MIILLITSGYSQAGNAIKLWYRRIVSLKYSLRLMYIFHLYLCVFGRRKAMLQNLRPECNTETRAHSLSFLLPYCM